MKELNIDQDVSDLIGEIYEAALRPHLWPDVLRRIALYTPSAVAALYTHDLVARAPIFNELYGDNPAYTKQYIEKWAADNPLTEGVAALNPGDIAGLASILDYDAYIKTDFHKQWVRPQGYCDAINVILERTPRYISTMSLIRSDEHGMSDTATIARLRLLAPHLLRAVKIGQVFNYETVEKLRLHQMIDSLADAVFLLNRSGEMLHTNDAGRTLLKQGLQLGRLKQQLANSETPPKKATDAILVETHDGARHVCHVLPLNFDARFNTKAHAELTVAIIRARANSEAMTSVAKSLFGLTVREKDVLFALLEIGSVPAVAEALGLARETVRAHLKALFRKTDTNRQADLVKLVCGLETPFGGR